MVLPSMMIPAVIHKYFNINQGVENRPYLCYISRDTRPNSTMMMMMMMIIIIILIINFIADVGT